MAKKFITVEEYMGRKLTGGSYHAQKCSNKFGISFAYSYLCRHYEDMYILFG